MDREIRTKEGREGWRQGREGGRKERKKKWQRDK